MLMEVSKMQKILIIEDDEKLRNELETFLNKNGFEIGRASCRERV